MTGLRLTKGELKRQRDALKQYERYLPTLQLKKQQLQIEIFHQENLLREKIQAERAKRKAAQFWAALLIEQQDEIKAWIRPSKALVNFRNIAGVDIPVFERADFPHAEYDLFTTPLWVDAALESLRQIVLLNEEIIVIEKGVKILKNELRVTTQRVNLFEKVKIPEATLAIRLIKIYIGDQMVNAVGRSKMAKRKIEEAVLEEVLV